MRLYPGRTGAAVRMLVRWNRTIQQERILPTGAHILHNLQSNLHLLLHNPPVPRLGRTARGIASIRRGLGLGALGATRNARKAHTTRFWQRCEWEIIKFNINRVSRTHCLPHTEGSRRGLISSSSKLWNLRRPRLRWRPRAFKRPCRRPHPRPHHHRPHPRRRRHRRPHRLHRTRQEL